MTEIINNYKVTSSFTVSAYMADTAIGGNDTVIYRARVGEIIRRELIDQFHQILEYTLDLTPFLAPIPDGRLYTWVDERKYLTADIFDPTSAILYNIRDYYKILESCQLNIHGITYRFTDGMLLPVDYWADFMSAIIIPSRLEKHNPADLMRFDMTSRQLTYRYYLLHPFGGVI